MPAGVFISYRREDAAPYARLLQYELRERFPEADVFVDMDSIEPGSDFAETIQRAVSSCAVLLALIGRQWLTLTDEEGQRRLEDPDDYVRLEIQTALTRGVRVIPVLVDNARALRHQQLPEPLAKLARLNAVELSYNRYQYDAERLLDAVGRLLTVTASTPEARLDEQQFLARLNDEGYRQDLEALLEAARSVGMLMEWGSSGASIRLPTPDRSEPLTVAWVFPSDTGWAGLRHLTLGYDTGSAAAIPSVQAALTQFVQAVGSIPGATPAKAKALEAYTFNPVAVRAQQVDLAGVLRRLVQTVREGPAQGLGKVPECRFHGLVMPRSGRTRVASRALRRSAAAMLRWPWARRRPMARLRRLAMVRGVLPVRAWEASSAKVVSRMWCSASMAQWPRM